MAESEHASESGEPGRTPVRSGRAPAPRWAVGALALTLALVAVTWPLLDPGSVLITDDGFVSDITMAGMPFRAFLQRALAGSTSLFWCPGIYCGFPLHAAPEAGFFYPPNWVLTFVGDATAAVDLGLFLHLLLAGAGVLFLLREERLSAAPAVFGALSFAAGGFLLAHLKHVAMVATAAWMPWMFAGLLRIARGGGREGSGFLLAGLAVAAMGLAGHPQVAYIGMVAGTVFYLSFVMIPGADQEVRARSRAHASPGVPFMSRRALRGVLLLVLAFVLGTAVAAVQHVPASLLARSSVRAELRGTDFAEQIPLEPRNLTTWFHARAVGMAGDGSYRGRGLHWEDYSYQGFAAVPLALIGLVAHRRRRIARAWAVVFGVTFLLALGRRAGLYSLAVAFLPGLAWFRFPARFLVVSELAVSVLAAHGLAWLLPKLVHGRTGRVVTAVPVAIILLLVLDLAWAQRPLNGWAPRAEWLDPPATVGDVPAGSRYVSLGSREAHVFAYEKARGWADVTPLVVQRRFLQPSLNLMFGVRAADGYANPVPGPTALVWGDHYVPGLLQRSVRVENGQAVLAPSFFTLARLAEVRTLFSLWPISDPRLEEVAVRPPVFTYSLPEPMPHAWFVPHARFAGSAGEALAHLEAEDIDPTRETVLLGVPAVENNAKEPNTAWVLSRVGLIRRSAAELVVAVDTPVSGYIRVAESFDPGWQARVDGEPAPVYQADLGFQAVPVPAGRHDVRLRYRPRGFVPGLVASAVGVLGFVIVGLFLRRKVAPAGAGA